MLMPRPFRFLRTIAELLLAIAQELGRIRTSLDRIANGVDIIIPNRIVLLTSAVEKLAPRAGKIARVIFTPGKTRPKGTKEPTMAHNLDQSQEQDIGTTFVRDDGTPNVTPNSVVHESTTPDTLLVVSLDPPESGFTIVPLVTRGVGQAKLTYDADLGAGVVTKEEFFDVEIVGGLISSVAFAPGATRPKRETPPPTE